MSASALDLFAERGPRSWQRLPKQRRDRAAGTPRSARLSVFYRLVRARALPALLAVGPAACENRWRVDQGVCSTGEAAASAVEHSIECRCLIRPTTAMGRFSFFRGFIQTVRFRMRRSVIALGQPRPRGGAPRRSRCPLGRVRQQRARSARQSGFSLVGLVAMLFRASRATNSRWRM